MKAPVDPASTARVLGDIADAVRPVERARTAAAVERVLDSAAPGYRRAHITDCPGGRRCDCKRWNRPEPHRYRHSTGHLQVADLYLPEVVSPHLFAEDPS